MYNIYINNFAFTQTADIIEYLKRLSKTSIPDGIVKFIEVRMYNVCTCDCV